MYMTQGNAQQEVPSPASKHCSLIHPHARVMIQIGQWKNITPTMISNNLKEAAKFCGPDLGFMAKDIS